MDGKNLNKDNKVTSYSISIALLITLVLLATCGQKNTGDLLDDLQTATPTSSPTTEASQQVSPTPVVIVVTPEAWPTFPGWPTESPDATPTPNESPTPTPTPTPEPEVAIWTSSLTHRFITGYTAEGELKKVFDLSKVLSAGGFSALTFIDRNHLIAFGDPGTTGERLVKINVATGEIDGNWYSDATITNSAVHSLVKHSDGRLLMHKSGTATQIESVIYNLNNGIVARSGSPWYTLAGCVQTTGNYVLPATFGALRSLLWLSSGTNSRINTIRNIDTTPVCTLAAPVNAYNYATSFPSSAAHIIIGGTQMPDGKIYVRFGNATSPMIAAYDFDGNIVSNGAAIFSDTGVLGTATTSRELIGFGEDKLIGAEWGSDSIFMISTSGEFEGFLVRDGYSIDVNAIAIRPLN